MTTLIGLAFGLYLGPTMEQLDYCNDAGWSYEIVCINGKCNLSPEAKAKAKICNKILEKYQSKLKQK